MEIKEQGRTVVTLTDEGFPAFNLEHPPQTSLIFTANG